MYTETDGIVLRQIKILNNRRILVVFTRKFGKISAGTNISDKGKGKAVLATKVFTYGKYEVYKNRESFNINSAEMKRNFFKLGEDIDKYMYSSYILEFTEKILPENQPAPRIFDMLIVFFEIMENRSKKYSTLSLVYRWKALQFSGYYPELDRCAGCGSSDKEPAFFSVPYGGLICSDCAKGENTNPSLRYPLKFDIIETLKFIKGNPLKKFEKLALNPEPAAYLDRIIKSYISYYLGINKLKSESFLPEDS